LLLPYIDEWEKKKLAQQYIVKRTKRTNANATKGYWQNVENRRKFFIEFAKEKGFDPYDASNWLKVTTTQLKEKQVLPNFFL